MDRKLPCKAKLLHSIRQPVQSLCLVFGIFLGKSHRNNLTKKNHKSLILCILSSILLTTVVSVDVSVIFCTYKKTFSIFNNPEKLILTCSAVHGSEQASPIAVSPSLAFPPHLTSPTLSTKPSKTTEAEVLENCPL